VHEDDGLDEVVLMAVDVVAADGMAKHLTYSTSQAILKHLLLNHFLISEESMPKRMIW